jgi:hypothetical protein
MKLDTRNLPPELLKQLSKNVLNNASTSHKVLNVLENLYDEPGTIDNVLIGLYRTYNKVYMRPNIQQVLFKLKKDGKVKATSYGIYALANAEALPDIKVSGDMGASDDE